MTTDTQKTTDKTSEAANPTSSPPTAKLRIGLVSATIWGRVLPEGTFYSVSFERRYRDKEGQWHTSHSFNTEDLLALSKLADQAHTRIMELRGAEAE